MPPPRVFRVDMQKPGSFDLVNDQRRLVCLGRAEKSLDNPGFESDAEVRVLPRHVKDSSPQTPIHQVRSSSRVEATPVIDG